MTYRDDRDALKSRIEELERELADARRRGEEEGRGAAEARANELSNKLAGLRGEVDRVEAELRVLRRRDRDEPGPNRAVWVVAAVPIVLGLLGALYVVFVRKPPSAGGSAPPQGVEVPDQRPPKAPEPPPALVRSAGD